MLPLYFLSVYLCSVALWQPAVFYCVPVFYLRTHSILKRTYVKTANIIFGYSVVFVKNFVLYHSLKWKAIPHRGNCGMLLVWRNYCLHFRSQHAYISLILFPLLQLCAVPVFISEGISNFISRTVANTKTRLTNFELPKITEECNICCYFLNTQYSSLYISV